MSGLAGFVWVVVAAPPAPTPADDAEVDRPIDEAVSNEARLRALERRVDELESQTTTLREENEALRTKQSAMATTMAEPPAVPRVEPSPVRIGGYVDMGFFWVAGNGSGVRLDKVFALGNSYSDDFSKDQMFMGDAYSVAINSRGEPADTGKSIAFQYDPIANRGVSSFIVNAANLDFKGRLSERFEVRALVDFVPRNRNPTGVESPKKSNGEVAFALNDFVDLKLANVRWAIAHPSFSLDLYVGKIDSVFGREYQIQESPDRMGVTPSLLCRYTCGRPTGIRASWRFLWRRQLTLNMVVTNGSTFRESFGFSNEIDVNQAKTGTLRMAYAFDLGTELEIGLSGQVGAQDFVHGRPGPQWMTGADLHLDISNFELTGEFAIGNVPGVGSRAEACTDEPCLRYMGAYGQISYRIRRWVAPYARVDWRDSERRLNWTYLYVAKLVRPTMGVRFDPLPQLAVKAEYTFNIELSPLREFPNDVFTTSIVGYY